MIDPGTVALFIPPGLRKFKLDLFERIGNKIIAAGGRTVRHDYAAVGTLPDHIVPIVGCTPQFRQFLIDWKIRKRNFIYWDRGYLRRVFATWLPNGHDLGVPMGFYRWHLNSFQMQRIDDVPDDRWKALKLDHVVRPWNRNGKHILFAVAGGTDYTNLFADPEWTNRTVAELRRYTKRDIILRDKESRVPLYEELKDAHCLVTHGSIAAVESVVMGCPVFVHPVSAAALVGLTDLSRIETPVYPERQAWLNSLAYNQWNEKELEDGTLWSMLK